MKNSFKVIVVLFVTCIALLAIVLIFKGITTEQFMMYGKRIALSALVLAVLTTIFSLLKGTK